MKKGVSVWYMQVKELYYQLNYYNGGVDNPKPNGAVSYVCLPHYSG